MSIRGIDQSDQGVEDALENLRSALRERVEAEHLRDGLTGLGSDSALTEWLTEKLEDGQYFVVGFLEVDRFKGVNDQFGYQNADKFLKSIGEVLRGLVAGNSERECVAFRAHGDEFYFGGSGASCEELFERARAEIEGVRLTTDRGQLQGTVSVGWMFSDDVGENDVLDERHVRRCLEDAVAAAKVRGRNRVVRYDPDLTHRSYLEGRQDCSCGCKFTVQVPVDTKERDRLYCPQCGSRCERPPSLVSGAG